MFDCMISLFPLSLRASSWTFEVKLIIAMQCIHVPIISIDHLCKKKKSLVIKYICILNSPHVSTNYITLYRVILYTAVLWSKCFSVHIWMIMCIHRNVCALWSLTLKWNWYLAKVAVLWKSKMQNLCYKYVMMCYNGHVSVCRNLCDKAGKISV